VGLTFALHAQEAALRIEGVSTRDGIPKPAIILTDADLSAMPRSTARVLSRDGKESVYEGVLLSEILKRVGQPMGGQLRGPVLARYALLIGHDGYRVLFSLPELDPAFRDARSLVADRLNGATLPAQDGPLRLVVPEDKSEARWIRMLERIEIRTAVEPVR
jgi:hypothetical protein